MSNIWMVRAGEGGRLIDDFARGYVGIGWSDIGDMSTIRTREEMREKYFAAYPNAKPGQVAGGVSMAYKFLRVMKLGDKVTSYDPKARDYLIGEVIGEYTYKPNEVGDYPNIRRVKWLGRVSRDQLDVASRNSLGSTLTLFAINQDVWADITSVMSGTVKSEDETEGFETEVLETTMDQAREFIKDRISKLGPYELQELVAGVLRGMGYKTRVSSPGADRGIDILASKDGFGFEPPRIVVECKHRKGSISSQDIRSFLGGRHKDDRGLYVSTGGFTKDARYEAERASIPVSLMDMDDLVNAVTENYELLDPAVRTLLPLVKMYWPA